jgi:hypothetical protein
MNYWVRHQMVSSTKEPDKPYQKGFACSQDLILGDISILIFVMQVEEPFDIVHQVVEHDAI